MLCLQAPVAGIEACLNSEFTHFHILLQCRRKALWSLLLKHLLCDLLLYGNRVVLGTFLNLKLCVRIAQNRRTQPQINIEDKESCCF